MEASLDVNTVERISQFMVDLGETGRMHFYSLQLYLFYSLVGLTILSILNNDRQALSWWKKIPLSDATFFVLLVITTMMFRVPLAVQATQNPDEPLWVATAKTLQHDPRIFVSVDTGTGGPLVPLFLILLKLVALPIDQGSIKIMSGLLMALSAGLLYLAGAKVIGSRLARIAIIPCVVLIISMQGGDMIAYNSEHPVIFLTAVSILFLASIYKSGPGPLSSNLVGLGITLGLIPFTKLQGVPVALFIGAFACILVYRRMRLKSLIILIIAGIAPAVIVLFIVLSYNGFNDFWMSYILVNLSYAGSGASGFGAKLNLFLAILPRLEEMKFLIYYSLAIVGAGILTSIKRLPFDLQAETIFAILFLAFSFYSVIAPGRAFVHYALLLILPMTVIVGTTLHRIEAISRGWVKNDRHFFALKSLVAVLLLSFSGVYYFNLWFTDNPAYLADARTHYGGYYPSGQTGMVLGYYFSPGDRLAVWEYEPELFEGSDYLLGTRYAATDYYTDSDFRLSIYMRDFERNKPKIFVQSSYRTPNRFEKYQSIGAYIKEHYTLQWKINRDEIYIRNDLLTPVRPWTTTIEAPKEESAVPSSIVNVGKNGSFLQIDGWAVTQDVANQLVSIKIASKSDTIVFPTFQLANAGVADYFAKPEYLRCGFIGLFPITEIPAGQFEVGIHTKTTNQVAFRWMNKRFVRDTL